MDPQTSIESGVWGRMKGIIEHDAQVDSCLTTTRGLIISRALLEGPVAAEAQSGFSVAHSPVRRIVHGCSNKQHEGRPLFQPQRWPLATAAKPPDASSGPIGGLEAREGSQEGGGGEGAMLATAAGDGGGLRPKCGADLEKEKTP